MFEPLAVIRFWALVLCLAGLQLSDSADDAPARSALLSLRENPSKSTEFINNEAYHFLQSLGETYRIDLNNAAGFEEEFARSLTRGDKDTMTITVSGPEVTSENIYTTMKTAFQSRYLNQSLLLKNDNLRDKFMTSEAGIWFFLAGVASSFKVNTEVVDDAIANLQQLAQKSILGKPFYPKQVVRDLMEGSISKMPQELAPLIKKLGEIIMDKGTQHSNPQELNADNIHIPAEFFQFWQELSAFVSYQMPRENILMTPMTLVYSPNIIIAVSNINIPGGGPLSRHQFQSLEGFLQTKTMQLLPINLEDSQIRVDFEHFARGFCKAQTRDQTLKLYLGKRHVNAAIRINEFRFLSENFRQLQRELQSSINKFSRAYDMQNVEHVIVVDTPDLSAVDQFLVNNEGGASLAIEGGRNALSRFEEDEE